MMLNSSRPDRCRAAAGHPAIEVLEERLLRTAWNWNAVMIQQDQAAADFPWLTGAGESVVVVDTGAYANHPSLLGKNIIWKDFVGTSSTPIDPDGHGTGASGIVAGNGFTYSGDGTYGQGIAPGAQLIVLRTDDGNDSTPWATEAQRIADAMDWVIANQAKYNIVGVNMSTGTDYGFSDPSLPGDPDLAIDQVLEQKFATLAGMGVFLGASAGNDGSTAPDTVEYPAADPNVYAISSVNSAGRVSSYASRGALTDLLAPAEDIVMPYYFPNTPGMSTTYYVNYGTGTSFSSPQVVGAAVLLKQIDPALTPAQIMQILQDSGTPKTDPTTGHTFSLLNLDAAIKLAYAEADDLNNHTLATATPLSFNGGDTAQLAGLKGLTHAVDYYTFTLDQASSVSVSVDYPAGDGDFPAAELLNSGGGSIDPVRAGGLTLQLAAGTYYLSVEATTTLTQSYGVTVTATPVADPPPAATLPGAGATSAKIAYDPWGRLHLAYYDGASQTLKYAMRNGDGSWNGAATVDATPLAGSQLSIAIDPYGSPGIAYYDGSSGRLKYAHFNGVAWAISTVDSAKMTGWQPSLCYTAAGAPYIAYYRASSMDLRVAALTGKSWKIATVDTRGNVGYAPSIAYDAATNKVGVGYEDLTHGWYKYAYTTGHGWKTAVVDKLSHASSAASVSLAFTPTHLAAMSYSDGYSAAVMLATSNGAAWTVQGVTGASSLTSQLTFESDGTPDIVYSNGSLFEANQSAGLWSTTPITPGGGQLDEASLGSSSTISWIDSSGAEILDLS